MPDFRTFRLEKLVHDGIVQAHLDEGGTVDFEVYEGEARVKALEDKLPEEIEEQARAKSDSEKYKEQQDVDNILFALGRLARSGFVPTKTFDKGHFIHTVTLPAESPWSDYYATDPERFPEETVE